MYKMCLRIIDDPPSLQSRLLTTLYHASYQIKAQQFYTGFSPKSIGLIFTGSRKIQEFFKALGAFPTFFKENIIFIGFSKKSSTFKNFSSP